MPKIKVPKTTVKLNQKSILAIMAGIIIILALFFVVPKLSVTSSTAAFGNTAQGTFQDQNDANAQSVSYFTCTSSTPVNTIMAYVEGVTAGDAMASIYETGSTSVTTSQGQTLTLEAAALDVQSSSVSISTSYSWVTFPLPSSFTPTSGITYGIAILGDVPLNIMEVSGSGVRDDGPGLGSYASGFSNPFGLIWTEHTDGAMSIYAAASTTASPTPTPAPGSIEIDVTAIPSNGGTVTITSNPASINPSQDIYMQNSAITVTATANKGYVFSYFTVTITDGASSNLTTNPYQTTMGSSATITAYFTSTNPTPTATPIHSTPSSPLTGAIQWLEGFWQWLLHL
jgi:hypothetical protein